MQPKVAIGCPVRNRAWVLPEYLDALERIEYEDKMFLFLENDSTDNTLDLLGEFEMRQMYAYVTAGEDQPQRCNDFDGVRLASITTNAKLWQRGDYAYNQYANLAAVRNRFLEMFLRTDADFLLSVDSDVIVPPDIVTRLLEQINRPKPLRWVDDPEEHGMQMIEECGGHIIGAAISNVPNKPLDGKTPGNFMVSNTLKNENGHLVPQNFMHPPSYPMHGVFPVSLIGAVYLIPRSVIEAGARYAPHGQGEDAPFCQAAQRLGYLLLVNMDVKCEHRMTQK